MKQYRFITEIAGGRAATIAFVGMLFTAFPLAIVMFVPNTELPQFAFVLCWIAVAGGSLIIGYAAYAQIKRVTWTFEADQEKIRWSRSDRVGILREIAVRDVTRIIYFKGDSASSGDFLYIESRAGERFDVSGIVPYNELFDFVRDSCPNVITESK
jgi:hypothetical protein